MTRHARDQHRRLDRQHAEACARDGGWGGLPDIARPIRQRKDIIMSDGVLLKAAKLWSKKSQKNGKQYLVGRLGGLRVLVFENADRKAETDATHLLMIGAAPDKPRPAGDGS